MREKDVIGTVFHIIIPDQPPHPEVHEVVIEVFTIF
jgi:hypothetical protein